MRNLFLLTVAGLFWLFNLGYCHAQPLVELVDTSRFPLVEIRLGDFAGADRIDARDIQLEDNDALIDSLIWEAQSAALPLKLALIVDRRAQSEGVGTKWDRTKDVTQRVLGALYSGSDSAVFIHAGGSVDNTDLNDNFPVLDIILQGLEPEGQAFLFDAIQVGLDALKPVEGRRAILLISQGADEGSTRSAAEVLAQANEMGVPIHLYHIGSEVPSDLRKVARSTGGKWLTIGQNGLQAEGIPIAIDRLRRVHSLSYVAPEKPGPHALSIQIPGWESPLEASYQIGAGEGELEAESDSGGGIGKWLILLLVLAVIAGGVWFFLRRKHTLHQASVVSPTLTDLRVDGKKGLLILKFNLPNQQIPGRISIQSSGGRPVLDHVVSHRQSSAKLDLKEVSEGVYFCSISHAGLVSEPWEFVWQR